MGKDSVFDYESFYKQWFLRSRNFAQEYVSEPAEAENIVQEVFVNIYERKDLLAPDINLTVYLFSAIKNRCINYLTNKLRQRTVYASDYEQEYVDKLSLRTLDASFLIFGTIRSITVFREKNGERWAVQSSWIRKALHPKSLM